MNQGTDAIEADRPNRHRSLVHIELSLHGRPRRAAGDRALSRAWMRP